MVKPKLKSLRSAAISVSPSYIALAAGVVAGFCGGLMGISIVAAFSIVTGFLEDITKGY